MSTERNVLAALHTAEAEQLLAALRDEFRDKPDTIAEMVRMCKRNLRVAERRAGEAVVLICRMDLYAVLALSASVAADDLKPKG